MKAVIPAAGLGTRFLPATKAVPKELLPILDKPVIQYVVEEALEPSQVDGVVIITSHDKPQIEGHFERSADFETLLESRGKQKEAQLIRNAGTMPVSFVYQDEPLGLGHAVHCAADEVGNEPFFVLLGDYVVPSHRMNLQMAEVSKRYGGASVIAVAPVKPEEVSRYGIIAGSCVGSLTEEPTDDEAPGAIWRISELVEKPAAEDAPSHLYVVGRYLLTPRVMELLADQEPGAGGEIQLTDAMERLLAEEDMYALVVDPQEGFDTGTPASWAASNVRMALKGEMASDFREALIDVEL